MKRLKPKVRRGRRMTKGGGWHLETTKGRKRRFIGKLLGTHNLGSKRVAIFSVPKRFG